MLSKKIISCNKKDGLDVGSKLLRGAGARFDLVTQIRGGQGSIKFRDRDIDGFQERVITAIQKIMHHPNGRELIFRLSNHRSHTVHIELTMENSGQFTSCVCENFDKTKKSHSVIVYITRLDLEKEKQVYAKQVQKKEGEGPVLHVVLVEQPFYVLVAHELIHALHFMDGIQSDRYLENHISNRDQNSYHSAEEQHTIEGFVVGGRKICEITENTIREENGLPHRYGH